MIGDDVISQRDIEYDAEGNPTNLDDLEDTGANNKVTQLNGPVLDPTFAGRDQQTARLPFIKGKKTVS